MKKIDTKNKKTQDDFFLSMLRLSGLLSDSDKKKIIAFAQGSLPRSALRLQS